MTENEFCGIFIWGKSGNMGDQFPLPVQATLPTAMLESDDNIWNKGTLWIKTDAAMKCEKEHFAKSSEYGDPDMFLENELIGTMSDLFVNRIVFQKEGDDFISNMPPMCVMTNYRNKDVYLFDDCPAQTIISVSDSTSGEKKDFPVWAIPFSENHPMDYLSDDGDYDAEAIYKWPIYFLSEEETA